MHRPFIRNQQTDLSETSSPISRNLQFVEQCKKDGRYLPRLTKAILGNGFSNLMVNKSRLGRIKKDYGLQIELTKDGKLIYNRPEDASEILNLLMEHYVTSALTEKKMLAKAIEEYNIR